MNISKKPLAIAVILLFFSVSVIPSTGTTDVKQVTMPTSSGNILYVGGSGPGNYSKIQDAINDASDGDTVYVYNGLYKEYIIINKSLNLVGESKENTIIDFIEESSVNILIINDGVSVSGFSLCGNSNISLYSMGFAIMANSTIIKNNLIHSKRLFGISINDWLGYRTFYNNTIIENNLIDGGYYGIYIRRSNDNIVFDNKISNYENGLHFEDSNYNIISKNNFIKNSCAIYFDYCRRNIISNNTFDENLKSIYLERYSGDNLICFNNIKGPKGFSIDEIGIYLVDLSCSNNIRRNKIYCYNFGIFIVSSHSNEIEKNTFLNNIINARFFTFGYSTNIWVENYWNRPRILPKPIFGIKEIYHIIPKFMEYDMKPAQEPYDIEV